jgi:hypothetical protein
MSATLERVRLLSVQTALQRLVKGGGYKTRHELFFVGIPITNSEKEFQRRTLAALENNNVISKSGAMYTAKDATRAQHLASNPADLSQIVWKSGRGPESVIPGVGIDVAPLEPVVLQPAKQEEAPLEQPFKTLIVGPPAEAPQPPTFDTGDSQKQLLERLVVIVEAACQSIIYTREKVDAMEQKLNHLWEQLK